MRLINYGPGELTDRLTILSLKLLFGTEADRDLTLFQTERTALLTQIRSRTLNGKWFDAVLDLAAVNAALWHAEDDLRAFRGQYGDVGMGTKLANIQAPITEMVNLGFRIQALNDQRAALVDRINKDAGEALASDKVFPVRETPREDL